MTTIANLRRSEFARLDATGSVYLDYTGAALYPESLVRLHAERLLRTVMGNPHSDSAPSRRSTVAIERARQLTLELLDANPAEYDVVFTANASAAVRILAEAFPFCPGSRLVMTADNHNSVNGLREAARRKGASVTYIPLDEELRADDPAEYLGAGPGLFAFPAQSNFSGVHHPLNWITEAQERGYHVLLDAAGFVPSNRLSLRTHPADFVAISFYKMFGYPTGVGALIARRDALAILQREYFAGGTVNFVSVQDDLKFLKQNSEAFEDGTQDFLAMPAICDGLKWMLATGMDSIHDHIETHTSTLLERLSSLGDNIALYGPLDSNGRGGTVAFNLYSDGELIPYEAVEAAANQRGIAVRGGCFCNPGSAERAFSIPPNHMKDCLSGKFSMQRLKTCLGNIPMGAIRASVGIATNTHDIDSLVDFARHAAQTSAMMATT